MMKQRFSKLLRVILALTLCAGMLFTAIPTQHAEAAKMTNKKAQKILKKKIKNKFCKYTFVDIDQDKIDEMVVLGYSGKFTDGDDAKRSVTVYKVSGKKAKSVFSHSIKGNSFGPLLSVNMYRDEWDFYLSVGLFDELTGYSAIYTYNGKNFVEIARNNWVLASGEETYHFGKHDCTEEEYNEYTADIYAAKLDIEFTEPSAKITDKYVKKLLKANFEYRKSKGYYDGYSDISTSYRDYDGDGVNELYVRMSDFSGEMLYYYPGDNNYYVGSVGYEITGKDIEFDEDEYEGYLIHTNAVDESIDDQKSEGEFSAETAREFIFDFYMAFMIDEDFDVVYQSIVPKDRENDISERYISKYGSDPSDFNLYSTMQAELKEAWEEDIKPAFKILACQEIMEARDVYRAHEHETGDVKDVELEEMRRDVVNRIEDAGVTVADSDLIYVAAVQWWTYIDDEYYEEVKLVGVYQYKGRMYIGSIYYNPLW